MMPLSDPVGGQQGSGTVVLLAIPERELDRAAGALAEAVLVVALCHDGLVLAILRGLDPCGHGDGSVGHIEVIGIGDLNPPTGDGFAATAPLGHVSPHRRSPLGSGGIGRCDRRRPGAAEALVHVVPDVPALQPLVGADSLPVLLEVAGTVPHGVRVLAHDDGPSLALVLGPLDGLADLRIHGRELVDGGVIPRRMVVDRSVGVVLPDPVGHGDMARSEAGLVPERPHDDARVVLVPLHHALGPIHEGALPLWVLGEAVPVVVRLQVRLIEDVETVLVAQVIELGVIGVVRGPHCVHVVAFENEYVLDEALARNALAVIGVVVVPIHSADDDGHAVHVDALVLELHPAEPHSAALGFDEGAVFGIQGEHQCVEGRELGRPLGGGAHQGLEGDEAILSGRHGDVG